MSKRPSFFAELKRRNVYKVAIAYAVAGGALAEGASQIFCDRGLDFRSRS